MKITKDIVGHVAHLGRLELDPGEIELYTIQIGRVLEYIDKLNTLDTINIEPANQYMPMDSSMREDKVSNSFEVEESMGNAPERKGSFFKVPSIMELEG